MWLLSVYVCCPAANNLPIGIVCRAFFGRSTARPAMIILTSIYQILIGPLELFFEVVFSWAYQLLNNAGLSIIFLSLAMNFLVLPLYRRADAMQEAERDRSARMKPDLDHIRKTFKGDERFMVQQTYYRQNGYKQTDALKGTISLLLEIPFFIAAYHFLSNLELLRGVTFGPLADLGSPDALIQIGDVTINFLPLLMTAINVVSAAVYMKGFPLKSKVQMYGIAAIFLVLLYASPSGLVFYWTLNNLFSLVKNLFYKLKHPGRVLAGLASATGIVLLVAVLVAMPDQPVELRAAFAVCALLLQAPILISVLRGRVKFPSIPEATKKDDRAYLIGSLLIALITGVLIPMSVIQASPSEFVDLADFQSPLWYVFDSFLIAFGTFVVWFGIFYRLASPQGRYLFGAVLLVGCGIFIVDYLFFGTGYGDLSPLLQFDATFAIDPTETLINLAAVAAVTAVLLLVWKKKRAIANIAYASLSIAVAAMFVAGAVQVNGELEDALATVSKTSDRNPHFALSTEGKNVVVIMMDRAISAYVPYIMDEHPEIKAQYDGFVWYSNAISYGSNTNVGSPGLYGGYEYIPDNMNARADVSLADKQDEALRVMPVLFDEAGYDVTVFDPTYAGYAWTPDLSIYDDHPDIDAYITMDGSFASDEFGLPNSTKTARFLVSRNFFCYSLFKVAPLFAQGVLYNNGNYNSAAALPIPAGVKVPEGEYRSPQVRDGVSRAQGVDETFLKRYAVLQNMPEMTEVSDSEAGGFLMMSNDTAHSPAVLQEPECRPAQFVDNTEYDLEHAVRVDGKGNAIDFTNDTDNRLRSKTMHYESNTAALRELGNWFDYLREQGLYDNTRIIIVSDHGQHLELRDDLMLEYTRSTNGYRYNVDMQKYNCLLMVKDFDATGFTADGTFMTNADVPLLALSGIVDDPVNPATGNPLTDDEKYAEEHHVQWPSEWSTSENNGNVFKPGEWFCLTGDNALDGSSWSYLGYY